MALKGFGIKLDWSLPKAFNKMKPISEVKQVSNTTSRVDNDKTSWVQSFEYDEEKQELTVVFKDGFTCLYLDIPNDMAIDFSNAPSKGHWVHENLWNRDYLVV